MHILHPQSSSCCIASLHATHPLKDLSKLRFDINQLILLTSSNKFNAKCWNLNYYSLKLFAEVDNTLTFRIMSPFIFRVVSDVEIRYLVLEFVQRDIVLLWFIFIINISVFHLKKVM